MDNLPDWASVLGFLVGLVGIALAVYFRFRPRVPKKKLLWSATTSSVVDPQYPGIEVRFEGNAVPRVSLTTVTIQNGGGVPIVRSDLVPTEHLPPKIPIPPAIIPTLPVRLVDGEEAIDLKAVRLVHGNPAPPHTNGKAGIKTSTLAVDFAVLEPGDSLQFGVLHTGSTNVDVTIEAHLVGGSIERSDLSLDPDLSRGILAGVLTALVGLAGGVTASAVVSVFR